MRTPMIIMVAMTSKSATPTTPSVIVAPPLLPHSINPTTRCHHTSGNHNHKYNHKPHRRRARSSPSPLPQPQPQPQRPTSTSTRECASRAVSAARAGRRTHSTTRPTLTRPPPRSQRRCISAPATRCRARRSPSACPASPRKRCRGAGRPSSRLRGHPPPRPFLGCGRGTAASTRRSSARVGPLRTVRLDAGSP